MPSPEEVQQQIKSLDGVSRFLSMKEIKELPSILWEDECIEKLTTGLYNNGNGIVVATNKRLIFVDKGLLYGIRVEDFPYDKITSIQYKTGMLMGEITIFASGNKADITHIDKVSARNFAEHVRARITSVSASAASQRSTSPSASEDEVISKLERLGALKSQGILTEEEFQEQKARILRA
jgi:hypothetical protein